LALAHAVMPVTCSKASTLCWASVASAKCFLHGNLPACSLLRFHSPLRRRQLLLWRCIAGLPRWPTVAGGRRTYNLIIGPTDLDVGYRGGSAWLPFQRRARVWQWRPTRVWKWRRGM
jgi:hypothetical protein